MLGYRNVQVLKSVHRYFMFPVVVQCRLRFSDDVHSNKLLRYFQQKIKATGPITVAEYMKEVLTNPLSGYYMHRDVFGSSGDFITSPEISQMFGELIAVWFYHEWSRLHQPQPLQIVELGPGRGTLADDILRVFSRLNNNGKKISLHLVEVSPHLQNLQREKLCAIEKSTEISDRNHQNSDFGSSSDENCLQTRHGFSVTWHQGLETVPAAFSLFLAHEFFDALPIHKFKKTDEGWREVLLQCEDGEKGLALSYVLSKGPTLASKAFIDATEQRKELELSPESGRIIEQIALRLRRFGGISLIIDYGYANIKKMDTFRAFRNHKLHEPLLDPGSADLTADVDFSYLIKLLKDEAIAVGPILQAEFLKNMGIDTRLEKLLDGASSAEAKESLKSGYKMLLNPEGMGGRYKVLALYPHVLKDALKIYPPAGFS